MGMSSYKYGGLEHYLAGVTSMDSENQYFLVYNDKPLSEDYLKDLEANNVGLLYLNLTDPLYVVLVRFIKLLRQIRPDIVHLHFGGCVDTLALIARIFGVKHVFKTIHCCNYRFGKHVMSYKELGIREKLHSYFGMSPRLYDKVHCVSNFIEKQYRCIFHANNTCVIYLGVQEPHQHSALQLINFKKSLNIDEDSIVVTTVLFASAIKGPDVFIRALPLLNFKYKALIIGLDENLQYTRSLYDLAKSLGVFDNICWVGVTNQVYKYLLVSDMYVQPSRTEAFGLSVVEAMSYSLPVIASNVGGLTELTGNLFPSGDYEYLAAKLNQVQQDPVLKEESSRSSFIRWESSFRQKDSIKNFISLYDNLV